MNLHKWAYPHLYLYNLLLKLSAKYFVFMIMYFSHLLFPVKQYPLFLIIYLSSLSLSNFYFSLSLSLSLCSYFFFLTHSINFCILDIYLLFHLFSSFLYHDKTYFSLHFFFIWFYLYHLKLYIFLSILTAMHFLIFSFSVSPYEGKQNVPITWKQYTVLSPGFHPFGMTYK